MNSENISIEASVFQAKIYPEEGKIVGYAALIKYLELEMPYPYQFSLIARKTKGIQHLSSNSFGSYCGYRP